MRILHTVEFYYPSVGGAQEVVRQISERLAQRGHDVTIATTKLSVRHQSTINGVRVQQFSVSGNAVRGFQGDVQVYQDFLLQGQFDVMMNYAAQQWATDLVFPLLGQIPFAKVLAPCGFSGLNQERYAQYFNDMPDVLAKYDHLVFHSATYQDVEFTRQHGISHYTVIPNGAAAEEFAPADTTFRQRHRIPDEVPLLLTVGSHSGLKGHTLVIDAFCRAQIGRAVLVVNGNVLNWRHGCYRDCFVRSHLATISSRGQKRVLLLNPPRADVVAAFQAADLFVFGSNVECSPLVLFEAMASRTPFVTVACGNAEEIAEWGNGGIVVPTRPLGSGTVTASPGDMAVTLEHLIRASDERKRLADQGHQAWRDRFTWDHITSQYEQLYSGVIAQRRVAPSRSN